MKKMVFLLSILLAVVQPALSGTRSGLPIQAAETIRTAPSFFQGSKHTESNLYLCLLDEDNEDSNSTERKKKSEKVDFSAIIFTPFSPIHFRMPVKTESHPRTLNFLALRVLRL